MKSTSATAILVAGFVVAGSIYLVGNQVARAISKPYDECVELFERHNIDRDPGVDGRQRLHDAARMHCRVK